MKVIKYFGHFCSAYGVCWLLLFIFALITTSRINLHGLTFGALLVICAIYAWLRYKTNPTLENAILKTGNWFDDSLNRIFKKKNTN